MTLATPSDVRLPLDQDMVERLSGGRQEPKWLLDARLASLERYTAADWPTGSEEEWRRFPLKDVPRGALAFPVDGPRIGGLTYTQLPEQDERAGVVFQHWSDAVQDHPDLVRKWIGDDQGVASHPAFRSLAGAAFAHGSTFLYVPAGVDVSVPLVAQKEWPAAEWAIVLRTVVVAEPNSSVTFVEELGSEPGPARLAIPRLDVHAGPGARVRYVQVQRFGDGVWDLGTQRYVSDRESFLESFNVLVGSARTKLGVGSEMTGDGAEVKLYGLVAAGGSQRIDVNSLQSVDGKASQSDLLYLSALYDRAKAVYYGMIRVEKTSSGTGSYQECRNLLLSDKAGADPIPVLEILTNDVTRCGHGATAGKIDQDEVFYVRSRGIDEETAKQLLVRGSFARVLDRIPEVAVRRRVLDALQVRIGSIAEVEAEAA